LLGTALAMAAPVNPPSFDRLRMAIVRHQKRLLTAAAVFLAVLIVTFVVLLSGLPDGNELGAVDRMPQATTLYDIHDRPIFTIFKEYRVEMGLADLPPHLRDAVLAIEDRRFFDHGGLDAIRIAGAAWGNFWKGRAAEGGSTITQQLAREFFLTRKKTLWRKASEAVLAFRLEHRYSKEEILEFYLNKVYFGDGLYGVGAAARGYFGKLPSDLTLGEAALVAGLINAPSLNAPTTNPSRALARRSVVLAAMVEAGFITQEASQKAARERLALRDVLRRQEPLGQHFKEEARQQLVKQFGWERLSEGGLRVYTTIDAEMQRAAEAAVSQGLTDVEARRVSRNKKARQAPEAPRLEAALVALDPATGEVRAMVGGRDFAESPFNRSTQALRQPGSAFKPFVYATALEAGYSPASLLDELDRPIETAQGPWMPDDGHSTDTAMTIRTALRISSNRAAAHMLQEVGIPETVAHARAMGIGTVPSVPSLALGAGEVTLMSMTAAYAAFADQGRVRTPTLIRRVEDADGKVLFEALSVNRQAVSASTAFLMASMLRDVIDAGTAHRARREGFTLPAAGKTGTTNDFVDAWFVGFTPHLVAGVWMGFDQPRTIIGNGFAAELAVPLWTHFMKKATAGHKPDWFTPPSGTTTANVCSASGLLAGAGCAHVYREYFARGTAPTRVCQVHGPAPATASQLAAVLQSNGVLPSSPDAAALTPAPAPTAISSPAPETVAAVPPPPRKAPGFWSRIFGRGRSKEPKDDGAE
jgi:1A family penicillin-binding protein